LGNIKIKTGVKADSDLIKNEAPDTLIIAAGSQPVIPPVEGIEGENVFTAEEIMLDKSFVPNKVVVVGGGLVGCDTALELASRGCEVTIVEMMPEIARDIGLIVKMVLLKELEEAQVKVITGKRLKKVTQEGIILEEEGRESPIAANAVVLAVGYRSRNVESLKGIVKEEYVIGDAREVAKASDAIEEGFLIGLKV
jgi:pyruvate/2-oxoglutarate dehydrogenase complex dihydrolipoamide dehydrogenase (E3) component